MTNFIHIGIGKTGTTSIQNQLFAHREELKREGFLYPEAGLLGQAHYGFFEYDGVSHHNKMRADQAAFDLLTKERSSFDGHVVISSENLSYAPEAAIDLFAQTLGESKIIFYCRPQIEFVESVFLQWVKDGWDYRDTIERFWKRHQDSFDFGLIVEPWAKRFGAENIVAHVYDRRVVGPDITKHFFKLLGSKVVPHGKRLNQSLLPEFFEVVDSLRAYEARDKVIHQLVEASAALAGGSNRSLITHETAIAIANRYERPNKVFAEKYLAPNERALLRPINWPRVAAS